MAHIVTTKCLGCKFTDCVEVCPVACFYEIDGQLIIHPDECIDCTACVAECPVEAIYADSALPDEFQESVALNAAEAVRIKAAGQAAITAKKDPLPTAEKRKAELGY
jgi:ferredoxin